ncbi:MAG: biopolymer transporter ExbD [Lentisphaeria bacterium]|nr:biopolymer transporter ExbD [Candidatus Neomarinimicrobiota bacterium]MCF7842571.1 biopolymer transporter ExbD [Lentisphaeria bacterium]
MRKQRGSKLDDKGMDLTPLIDTVFLLLIFFMVTTVFSTTPGIEVDLPKAAESEAPPEKDLNILISDQGVMELNGTIVTLETLEPELRRQKDMYRSKVLIIKADKLALHYMVVDVMDAAKAAGIDQLAIAADPEDQNSP